jgi:hypothetical protein
MHPLFETRQLHGDVYVTCISKDIKIPWRPLSLGDYLKYVRDYSRQVIPPSILEDEIFKSCVVDKTFIRQMPFMKAGIISTVVQNIWEASGPGGIDEFNQDLETARMSLFSDGTRVLQDLVQLITMAFPYKPEEIYAMDYETFLLRVAQAEKKLLEMGMIQEPVDIVDGNNKSPQKKRRVPMRKLNQDIPTEESPQPRVDAKALWDEQESRKKISKDTTREKWWDVSPVLESTKKKNIDFTAANNDAEEFVLDNDEKATAPEVRKHIMKMKTKENTQSLIQDARWIYKDLITALEAQKKPK